MKPYALLLALTLAGCGVAHPVLPVAVKAAAPAVRAAKGTDDVVRAVKVSAAAMLGYADKDKDGKLSAAEALAVGYNAQIQAVLDADHDGALTLAEITSDTAIQKVWLPMMGFMGQLFGGLDRNKDGNVSRAELDDPGFKVTPTPWLTAPDAQIVDKAFAACDRDANGGLDADERVTFLAYMVERGYKLNISVHG